MDYLTPLEHRGQSFKEFVVEWVFGQFERNLESIGLRRPWYWDRLAERPQPLLCVGDLESGGQQPQGIRPGVREPPRQYPQMPQESC